MSSYWLIAVWLGVHWAYPAVMAAKAAIEWAEFLNFCDRKNERKHAAPAGDTPGSVTNKIQVFGKDGASLGFVPVCDDIESGS